MIIGITGASGSGKTLISNMLKKQLNATIVDADDIAKKVAMKNTRYYEEIVEYFGEEILNKEKDINRRKLAEIIYADDVKREKLNDLTKIYVVDEIKKEAVKAAKTDIVAMDVIRLIESGLNEICDVVISVIANDDIRLKRICERDGIDIEFARQRLQIQPKDEFYIAHSNYIIDTNNENLEEQVKTIVNQIIKER